MNNYLLVKWIGQNGIVYLSKLYSASDELSRRVLWINGLQYPTIQTIHPKRLQKPFSHNNQNVGETHLDCGQSLTWYMHVAGTNSYHMSEWCCNLIYRDVIQVRQGHYRPIQPHEKLSSSWGFHCWQITKRQCKKVAGDNKVQANKPLLIKIFCYVYYTVNNTYHFRSEVVYRLSLKFSPFMTVWLQFFSD